MTPMTAIIETVLPEQNAPDLAALRSNYEASMQHLADVEMRYYNARAGLEAELQQMRDKAAAMVHMWECAHPELIAEQSLVTEQAKQLEGDYIRAGGRVELSFAQARLVELDLRKPEIQAYYEELEKITAAVAAEVGMDGYFQAPDGTVYKLVKPADQFVTYRQFAFERTKRDGESRGTLSMKEAADARANGFKPLPV